MGRRVSAGAGVRGPASLALRGAGTWRSALRPGRNVIAATVWRFGSAGPIAQMGSSTAFLLRAEDPRMAEVNTGLEHGWEVRRDTGRTEMKATDHGYRRCGDRASGWTGGRCVWEVESGDEGWSKPVSRGPAARREVQDSGNDWMLVEDALPQMTYTPTEAGQVVRATEERQSTGGTMMERADLQGPHLRGAAAGD